MAPSETKLRLSRLGTRPALPTPLGCPTSLAPTGLRPGRAYRKAILVPFHVKGPEGAPFLAGDRVYVMRPDDPDAELPPSTS